MEDVAISLVVLFGSDAELFMNGERKLQGVNTVEPQPVAKKRGVGLDLLGGHVLQHQRIDDEVLEPVFDSLFRHLRFPQAVARTEPPPFSR